MIVTVEEVKTHLRIDHNEEDGYLLCLIAEATAMAEDFCRTEFEDNITSSDPKPAPEPVRLAVLLMVSYLYENRDLAESGTQTAAWNAFQSLLYPYRNPEKMF